MNTHLLQIKLSPIEYQQKWPPVNDAYMQAMPDYLIARCPLCGAIYLERLDTYSLENWGLPLGYGVFRTQAKATNCPHFVVAHTIVNLNAVAPAEIHRAVLGCEVPHILPIYLPDDIPSYAVMHALPICRVEQERFVPRYSVYMITYYAAEPQTLIQRRFKDSETWNLVVGPERSWDLIPWVQTGRLQWIDATSNDLPLRTEPATAFPYAKVQGSKDNRNTYHDGRWVDRSFWGWFKHVITRRQSYRKPIPREK